MRNARNYTAADMAEVSENPEWTEETFARSKGFEETLSDLARSRGKQKAPTKEAISIRLDRDVIQKFRDTGPGWQSRINEALRRADLE